MSCPPSSPDLASQTPNPASALCGGRRARMRHSTAVHPACSVHPSWAPRQGRVSSLQVSRRSSQWPWCRSECVWGVPGVALPLPKLARPLGVSIFPTAPPSADAGTPSGLHLCTLRCPALSKYLSSGQVRRCVASVSEVGCRGLAEAAGLGAAAWRTSGCRQWFCLSSLLQSLWPIRQALGCQDSGCCSRSTGLC